MITPHNFLDLHHSSEFTTPKTTYRHEQRLQVRYFTKIKQIAVSYYNKLEL
jgi:hypothetical protein